MSRPPRVAGSQSAHWKNHLWNSYNDHLTSLFGEKVYKITLNAGFTCPVRDGTKGTIGCTFCDERGSSSFFGAERARHSIEEQLERTIPIINRRFGANRFLAYFQAFTNTYAPPADLKIIYDRAIQFPGMVGMAVGTRPDCVPDDVLELLASYTPEKYVSVELGLQSLDDRVLRFYQRRQTAAEGADAIERIRRHKDLTLVVHLMFGAPGETVDDAVRAAHQLNAWKVDGVKIHQLMILKGTVLERYYAKRPWPLLTMDAYNEIVRAFLENLDPSIHIERTHGLASHPKELVAPAWAAEHWEPMNGLKKLMTESQSYQGKALDAQTPPV